MITHKKIVCHVTQQRYEYWLHHSATGWFNVSQKDFERIAPKVPVDYVELRHDMPLRSDGTYGPYIIGA